MKNLIQQSIKDESARLQEAINLIPSENFPSPAVRETLGSLLVGEYAEGYPGKRYYEGRANIDAIEEYTRKLAAKLFRAKFANVQAYSGSVANLAIYNALLDPGDTIMGLDLTDGGHLSHGWKVTLSAKMYNSVQYRVDSQDLMIDYDAVRKLALKEKPKVIVAGFTAYPRAVDFKEFRMIADEVGAYLLADISHISGLVLSGLHPHPFPHADVVMMTTHKMLRGPRGAIILSRDKDIAQAIDRSVFPGIQGGPHENTIAAIGVALDEASDSSYKRYCEQVVKNAATLAEELTKERLDLVSGGTDNHLMVVDASNCNISGTEAAETLLAAGINVNRNTVPYEPRSPFDPSGIRLGTPAITTRGMKQREMRQIAKWIARILKHEDEPSDVQREVEKLTKKFPIR